MSKISFSIDGLTWYAGTGSQNILISQLDSNDRLIHACKDNRHMWALIKEDKIVEYVSNNNYNVCEVLVEYPKKLYFDIDGTPDLKLDTVMKVLYDFFDKDPTHWAVSGYESKEKNSYHIINNTYVIYTHDELLRVKKLVRYIKHSICDGFDDRVYNKNNNMKCINQSKPKTTNIQKIIKDTNPQNHFIASFITGTKSIIQSKQFQQYRNSETIDNLTIKNKNRTTALILPPDFTNEQASNAKQLLKITPSSDISHAHRWKVALFCYYNGLTEQEYWDWFMASNPSEIRQAKVKYFYDVEIPKSSFYAVSISNFRKYLSLWYPELLEETHFTGRFLESFTLDNLVQIDRIEPEHFQINKRVIAFNIPMGGGKTTTTLQYLKDSDDSFIWLAPRQTLISNTSHRMKTEFEIEHTCHLDIGKNKEPLTKAKKLLICNQSLHYLQDKQIYDTVVIDEIETALNSWDDEETHKAGLETNFNRFCYVIQKAKKVLLLDAFITTKTIKFLNSLGIKTEDQIIYNNSTIKQEKKLVFNDDFDDLLNKIADDIINNKKLFIFYAFKNATENGHYSIIQLDLKIKDIIKQKDIQNCKDLKKVKEINKIPTEQYKNSLLYYAESKEKNNLGNINEKWKEADYIITTSSITVGVNYEGLDYDKIYLICSGTVNNPRDIIQCSMRIRKPIENNIELFFFDLTTKDFKKYPEYYHKGNNIYKNLIINVYTEQQSDFKDSFRKFCDLTGYNYKAFPDLKKNKKRDSKKFVNDMFESRMLMEYKSIETIDDLEVLEKYQENVYNRTATLEMRMAVCKYFFDEKFKLLGDDDKAFMWNNRTGDYPTGIKHPLIKDIIDENKVQNLAELNLKKLEASQQLKDKIKEAFSFDIKMKNQLVIKTINNLLGLQAIIKQEDKKGHHQGYEWSNLFNLMNDINNRLIELKAQAEIKFLEEDTGGTENFTIEEGATYQEYLDWYGNLSNYDRCRISDADRHKFRYYLLEP
jgi:hypothetical protein